MMDDDNKMVIDDVMQKMLPTNGKAYGRIHARLKSTFSSNVFILVDYSIAHWFTES